jgi:hypothetical protein
VGPAGNWAYAYHTATIVNGGANVLTDVIFNNNGDLNGWTHTVSTAPFTCVQSGRYLVQYFLTCSTTAASPQDCSAVILNNGAQVAGSSNSQRITANNVAFSFSRAAVLNMTAGQTVSVQFAGSSANVQLIVSAGPATVDTSASITINRLS